MFCCDQPNSTVQEHEQIVDPPRTDVAQPAVDRSLEQPSDVGSIQLSEAAVVDPAPIANWTAEERQSVREVRAALLAKGVPEGELGEIELITITLNSKCRVDEAVEKFITYREKLLQEYGIEDVWADWEELHGQWHRLTVAGLDEGGRQIMWVGGGGTPVAEERVCIRACCLYFFAVHADVHTLRNGITLCINTANNSAKIGNEKKLQVAWQNFPTRPQAIFILGTTAITRVFINALIAFASLFAKNKVVARIRFATVADVAKRVGNASLPEQEGGDKRMPTEAWIKERLAAFPLMGLH